MRPTTLTEVAHLTACGDSFDRCLANFLDDFYAAPSAGCVPYTARHSLHPCRSAQALTGEPQLLAPLYGNLGLLQDAYLAATAEELARQFNLRHPSWADAEARKLHHPWFASPLAALRAVLLLESPPGFRSRNLFVSENALARA